VDQSEKEGGRKGGREGGREGGWNEKKAEYEML